MLHVRIGHHHLGQQVRLDIVNEHIRVVKESGESLGSITTNPDKSYQTMARPPEETKNQGLIRPVCRDTSHWCGWEESNHPTTVTNILLAVLARRGCGGVVGVVGDLLREKRATATNKLR
jgi:hypothetical protein